MEKCKYIISFTQCLSRVGLVYSRCVHLCRLVVMVTVATCVLDSFDHMVFDNVLVI